MRDEYTHPSIYVPSRHNSRLDPLFSPFPPQKGGESFKSRKYGRCGLVRRSVFGKGGWNGGWEKTKCGKEELVSLDRLVPEHPKYGYQSSTTFISFCQLRFVWSAAVGFGVTGPHSFVPCSNVEPSRQLDARYPCSKCGYQYRHDDHNPWRRKQKAENGVRIPSFFTLGMSCECIKFHWFWQPWHRNDATLYEPQHHHLTKETRTNQSKKWEQELLCLPRKLFHEESSSA